MSYHSRRKKNKVKWILVILAVLFVATLWNQGIIQDYLAGNLHFGGIVDNPLESKNMSSLVFEEINDARKEKKVEVLKYSKNSYNLAVAIAKKFHESNNYILSELELNEMAEIYNIGGVDFLTKELDNLDKSQFEMMISDWTIRNIFNEKTLNEMFTDGAVGCYEKICILILNIKVIPTLTYDYDLDYKSVDDYESSPSNDNGLISGIVDSVSKVATHDVDISLIESKVHQLINEQRENNGLSSISWDSKLSDIARGHSQDMIDNNFFDHTNLRGEDPTTRADKAGYSCYKDYGSYYTIGIAENIGGAPFGDVIGCGYVRSEQSIAECLVDGWMGSPGHRENILTASYDSEGIGVACDSSECFGTQNFC